MREPRQKATPSSTLLKPAKPRSSPTDESQIPKTVSASSRWCAKRWPDLSTTANRFPSLQARAYRLTVAALAREARVSRNAISSNHRAIVEALRAETPPSAARSTRKESGQRTLIETLEAAQRRLVTENAVLLKRALDAEAEAARLQRHNARLVAERDAAHRPIPIRRAGSPEAVAHDKERNGGVRRGRLK